MAFGGVGADHHDHVGMLHRVEVLRAGRLAEGLLEPVAGRRVAYARAGVDVVVAEGCAHQLLHQVGFLVGAARRRDAADGVAAVLGLDALELRGGVGDRLVPAHFLPRIGDVAADHRLDDTVRVGRVAPGEAALDAGVAVIGLAVLVGHHAHHLRAPHLGAERAAHAAIGAGRDHAALGLAVVDDRLFHQGGRGAGLHAGPARYALGVEEALLGAGGDHRGEAAAVHGQGERALDFLARAHAARAHDALGRIEGEVRVGLILLLHQMVGALVSVPHLAQAHRAGHLLQLAVAVGGTGQTVERVIGDVQLHHVAAQLGQRRRLRAHLHAFGHQRSAGGRVALAAFDLHQAQPAGAEGLQHVGRAQLGNAVAGLRRSAHDRGARRDAHFHAVDLEGHQTLGYAGRGAVIGFFDGVHSVLLEH